MRILLTLLFAVTSLFGTIFEVSHFRELLNHLDSETTLLLDIDDTLIAPVQMLGSDTWFEHRLKKHQSEGNPMALDKTLAEWEAIRHLSKMVLVEPDIAIVLSEIQQMDISMMGLTVQGMALATRTVLQLQELNIDLTKTAPLIEDSCLSVQGHTVFYRKGILFTSGKAKGDSFFKFSEENLPKRIVMMDDKLSHLQGVEKEALKRGVEFIGLRYGFSDGRKRSFSEELADFQMRHSTLTHLLSDGEAESLMTQGNAW